MRFALIAAIVLAFVPVFLARSTSTLDLVFPSLEAAGGSATSDAAARPVFVADFPGVDIPHGDGHDGQFFYVIARTPFDLQTAAEGLDRPRYREQRILFPLLAWVLHPTGGGEGLIWALVAVGVAAVFLGTLATGVVAITLGGRDWHGLLFAFLPGIWWALRLTTSETLALALTMAALALSLRRRAGWAVVVGALAVLTKEPLLLVLAGVGIWRRDRAGLALAAVPAAVAAGWYLLLKVLVDDRGTGITEFTLPGMGFVDSYRLGWSRGVGLEAAVILGVTAVLAVLALRRHGLRGPLGWAIALHLGLFTVMIANVVGLPANATRASAPLLLLALLALVTPETATRAAERRRYGVGDDVLERLRRRTPATTTATAAATGPADGA